ncbi:MAG: ABC transporter ATP-binding protein [Lentisphaeria bacterium]
MPLILDKVSKIFPHPAGDVVLFRELDLTLEDGGSLALVGPSGSGKTTLLRMIAALEPVSAGEIRLDGQQLTGLPAEAARLFRLQKIGFVYQEHRLLPQLTALENVLLPSLAARKDCVERARQLLDLVGLSKRADFFPAQLSGGECQRTALARALLLQPRFVLADEPTGQLDAARAEQLLELLQKINEQEKVSIIMATHSKIALQYLKSKFILRSEELEK